MHQLTLIIAVFTATLSLPTLAASSTSNGQVSVAQVVEMIGKSGSNRAFRNISIAYLAGVGETAGLLIQQAASMGLPTGCPAPLELSGEQALAAVKASGGEANWQETAATPVIVADMLARAGCK
ncbi:MAG TPA: hypothetical protein VIL30_10535 [Ramlibacter sp.]